MFESVRERESIVALAVVGHVFAYAVDEVTDVLTIFVPSRILFLALLIAIDRDFHAIIE